MKKALADGWRQESSHDTKRLLTNRHTARAILPVQYTQVCPSLPDLTISFSWLMFPVMKVGVCRIGTVSKH